LKKAFKIHFIVLAVFILLPQMISATTFSGGRTSGIFNAYYDSSVFSYGYSPHFDAGKNNWGSISSKVNITYMNNTTGYPDKYYVGTTSTSGLIGLTQPYKKNLLGSIVTAGQNDTWLYCTISIYDNQIKGSGLNYNQIVSSATTHEIGHSLSQAHSPSGVSSVMTSSSITDFAPTLYDKNELISKWGP